MTTDNDDGFVGGVCAFDGGDEAGGADDVEGGYAKEFLGVIDALGLEDFGGNGNGGVDLGVLLELM